MANCKTSCRLCPNLVLSTEVAFDAGTNTLNITIPTQAYDNGEKVCIVIAQALPAATTITALVNIIVGTGTFPLQRCSGNQVTAAEIRTRTRYSTHVVTNSVTGAFRLDGKVCVAPTQDLDTLPTGA